MTANPYDLVMCLIEEQSPALFVVGGAVFEGRVESCLGGVVTAIARPYGTEEVREKRRWDLREIELAPLEEPAGEDEDPLMQQSREMAARAKEYGELSLAERLVVDRLPKMGEPR